MKPTHFDDYAAFVGIDWADSKHDICLQCTGSDRREFGQVQHTPQAIAAWVKTLQQRIKAAGLTLPGKLPDKWVVDCKHVGKGMPALKYLSRYLYRGVISENNIIANQNGKVTFKYIDSNTGQTRYRTLKGQDFCSMSCPKASDGSGIMAFYTAMPANCWF